MHPVIRRNLMKAWITSRHRRAKQSTPFAFAQTIAELACRVLMLLRSRGPLTGAPTAEGKHWQPSGLTLSRASPCSASAALRAPEPAAACPLHPARWHMPARASRVRGPSGHRLPGHHPGSIISTR